MIDVQHVFHKDRLRQVLSALRDLPERLTPKYFGYDEEIYSREDLVNDDGRFESFLLRAESGFFLYAEDVSYTFLVGTDILKVLVFDVGVQDGVTLFRALSTSGSIFGFAADGEEYEHRNLLRVTLDNGSSEAWAGRDTSRYLPGIYWRTWISDICANRHNLPLDMLRKSSLEAVRHPEGNELCFFPEPGRWVENSARLDLICEETAGIFSISVVRGDFQCAQGMQARVRVSREWP